MKIDGNQISRKLLKIISRDAACLKLKGITPSMLIVSSGNDPASDIYIRRKKIFGQEASVNVKVLKLDTGLSKSSLIARLRKYISGKIYHGIIIQRPLQGSYINKEELNLLIPPAKDIDGFHPESIFFPPVALAVYEIIKRVKKITAPKSSLRNYLAKKKILVIGRGETAGEPIADFFRKKNIAFSQIHSKTENRDVLIKKSDLIISCAGRSDIVRLDNLGKGTILIGVGLHPDQEGNLKPDYRVEEILKKASFYTPVPGGVGPVNVAFLFRNLIKAAKNLRINR